MDDLRAELERLTIEALQLVRPQLVSPLHGGWSQKDELRFDENGQPMIVSSPRPDTPTLVLGATRALLDSPGMAATVQRVTDSGLLTERFLYDPNEMSVEHPWQLNIGLVQNFLLRYAELAPDLGWQEQVFAQVWGELAAYVDSGNAAIEVTSLLHHLRLDADRVDLHADGAIEALNDEGKRLIWARVRSQAANYLQQPLGWHAAVRTTIAWRRGEPSALQQGRDRHDEVLLALRLLSEGRVAISVSFADPGSPGAAFAGPGAGLSDLMGPGQPPWGADMRIAPADAPRLLDLIASCRQRKDDPKLVFALRRFDLSYTRMLAEDRLVDGWIALESLFSDPTKRDNIAERLAEEISRELRSDEIARRKLQDKIRRGYYEVRSRVVHGDPVPPQQVATVAMRTDGLLREALRRRIAL